MKNDVIQRAHRSTLAAFLLALLSVGPGLAGETVSPRADSVPDGLSASDWTSIRAAYEESRHSFLEREGGTHTAINPGQGWTISFDGRGFEVVPRSGDWTWGLDLQRINGAEARPSAGQPVGQRLNYDRGHGVEEWFINDGRGLEQGWTLANPIGEGDTIRLELGVRGELTPTVSETGISFQDAGGTGTLTYSGLKAWDAAGTVLPVRFVNAPKGIALEVVARGAVYPVTIDPMAQQAYLKASNTEANDNFGWSVAISGDTAVVGAYRESSSATGVNGDQADNGALNSGAAYVFVRTREGWKQQAYLKASNTGTDDNFGYSVAISGDTVVVGAKWEASAATGVDGDQADDTAPLAGAAYVFTRSGTQWTQQAYLKASNTGSMDWFGETVAISGDTLVVGASREASGSGGIDGDQADNSAARAGAAYVFVRRGTRWIQQAYLKAAHPDSEDFFGISVAISGNTVVVGAYSESSGATGIDGDGSDNSAAISGAAYVFVRRGARWTQQAYLKASNAEAGDYFGTSVAISGDTVVVGAAEEDSASTGIDGDQADNSAQYAGAAYVFVRSGDQWTQQAYLKASNAEGSDFFRTTVALAGETLVVGSPYENGNSNVINGNDTDNSAPDAGAVYLFVRTGTQWSQRAYLKASNTGAGDYFGISLALSGDTVIVGANEERSAAVGVDGDGGDDSAILAGAAYVFGFGNTLHSLSKSGGSAPGAPDLSLGRPLAAAISDIGTALFDTTLSGAGATGGRNRGIFSTLGAFGDVDLALLRTDDFGSLSGADYVPGNRVVNTTRISNNASAHGGLLEVTLAGRGLNQTNNRALLLDDGSHLSLLARTGRAIPELGGAQACAFHETLQQLDGNDLVAVRHKLLPSASAGVTRTNDSGILVMDHAGGLLPAASLLREGAAAFGSDPGTFGQFSPLVSTMGQGFVSFGAPLLPTGGGPALPGLFCIYFDGFYQFRNAIGGEAAPGAGSASFRTFLGLTSHSNATFRAGLRGAPAATNEGIWSSNDGLLLRKGEEFDPANYPGLLVRRILRFWAVGTNSQQQLVAWVVLGGAGVNGSNNQALLLRQLDGQFLVLMRTGDPAPGAEYDAVKMARILSVEVDPIAGYYAVAGSLRGSSPATNLALWTGQTMLGNDTTDRQLRLPGMELRKGVLYTTDATTGDVIRSIALKTAPDRTGAGGRGLAQVAGQTGLMVVCLQGDRGVQELVIIEP